MNVLDITEALNIRKWNEEISSIMSGVMDNNPESILIVLEDYLEERVANE
jgi:hypothetical protein